MITVNQQLYVEVAKRPEVELLLISPEGWLTSLSGWTSFVALPQLHGMVHPLPVVAPGRIHLHWYPGLGAVLDQFQPEIIFADEEPYSVVAYQALRHSLRLGCRFTFYSKQSIPRRYPPPVMWSLSAVLRHSRHALAINLDCEKVLRWRGFARGITQLPHGVDPEFVAPRDPSDLRGRLGLKGPVVGFVGRMSPEKGVWDLLGAARLLASRPGLEFTLLMIGDGPARWKLEEAARRDLPPGRCLFLGSVMHEAVPAYLNALDVLVLPSRTQPHWKEQFGRVLVEALACGVPVVGSDSGHIPTLITETGGGLVHREADPADLADKIEVLLRNPAQAQAMAARGRATVLHRYAYSHLADAFCEAMVQGASA